MLGALLTEYQEEVREQVCAHCAERAPGGPPCGKGCAVEHELPRLIAEVHEAAAKPAGEPTSRCVCGLCTQRGETDVHCAQRHLSTLVAQAVETVDQIWASA